MRINRLFTTASGLAGIAIFIATAGLTTRAAAQPRPDLRVTAINTPGGVCRGNANKVQASVQNSQMIGIGQPVLVTLHIQFPGGGQGQYQSTIQSGIGPGGNQPVWFNNVSLPNDGAYTFTVTADPANSIIESVENNNSLSASRTVQTACASPTYKLTIKVFEHGTWQGGQGQWIQGAIVTLQKQGAPAGQPPITKTTNSSGLVEFDGAKSGETYQFSTQKAGCNSVESTPAVAGSSGVYLMGPLNATRYLSLDCQR
jgi:hypothetical protein